MALLLKTSQVQKYRSIMRVAIMNHTVHTVGTETYGYSSADFRDG